MREHEDWQNSGQDQPHIRLAAPDFNDHIHHLRLCLVEYDLAAPASGQATAYRAGSAAGISLPGACIDQHSLHSGSLEGGKQKAGRHSAPDGGHILLLAGFEHPLRGAPQGLSNLELLTQSSSIWSSDVIGSG